MEQSPSFISCFGRPLRLAIIGGAASSGIGEVHRIAARIDGCYTLVAGVFSSVPERSRSFALGQGISADRAYSEWKALIVQESRRSDGAEVIAVMTPNDSHFEICLEAMKAGLHVICDKPLTTRLETSLELVRKSREFNRILAVTYCYTGYPMVRQAKAMVRKGELGVIRQVHVQYVQGWAADEAVTGWRLDPVRTGGSSIMIDIGTHAYHMATFVTGLKAGEVVADLDHVVQGRTMDNYGGILLRFNNGAHGTIWVTSAAAGSEHGLMFRVFGDKGGLEWHQETPNSLIFMPKGDFARTITRRISNTMTPEALSVTRTQVGHPEGYLEAFANIYTEVAWEIARQSGKILGLRATPDFPGALEGAEGLAFVAATMRSSAGREWAKIDPL